MQGIKGRGWLLLLAGALALALIAVVGYDSSYIQRLRILWPPGRFVDRTGQIDRSTVTDFNRHLEWLHDEMGVDVRFLAVSSLGGEPIEDFAVREARSQGVGRSSGSQGVFVVYDAGDRRLRIEVGPKLEGIFTDAFVSYLEREHVKAFASAGDLALGLRLTLFMMEHRLREAALGLDYDPGPAKYVQDSMQLAEGAGATASLGSGAPGEGFVNLHATDAIRAQYGPQATVKAAYVKYVEWLAEPREYTDVPLFTPQTRAFLSRLQMTRAYNDYILYTFYGRAYKIDTRGDLAMLYYVDTPFVSPWFFRHQADGWTVDLVAAVNNSQELIAEPYTWTWRWSDDGYSKAFLPDLARFGGVVRISDGDNRALPLHIDLTKGQ